MSNTQQPLTGGSSRDQNSASPRGWFEFTTRRPVSLSMIMATVVVLGVLAYQRLPMNLMPELTYPTITIRTEYPAATPEEVEDSLSRPIEEALGVVHGLVRISSISRAEVSDVILEFEWKTSMDDAVQDVRENLDQVILPEGVKPPLVLRYDPSVDPIMTLALYGHEPLTYLRYLADEFLKPELEGIEGVAAVRVKGGEEEEIQVEMDEKMLTQLGLSIQQVASRLNAENVNLAGGKILEGQTEYLVRTINQFKQVDDIKEIIVGYRDDSPIYLKNIAHVWSSHKERTLITRVNGEEAILLEIYREGDANIVQVARKVRESLLGTAEYKKYKEMEARKRKEAKEEEKTPSKQVRRRPIRGRPGIQQAAPEKPLIERLPKGLSITLLSDQSKFIQSSLSEVRSSALLGGLIAVLIIFLFLKKWATTLIIALTIPLSVVTTFLVMHLLGISLNMMSLGGLALGIGMLVDNAVVVLESIHRCIEEGDSLLQAVLRGTGEVGIAVSASTFTTICVFFPMIFVEGVAGQLFGDQALTIIVALLASLVIALFIIPMLRSRHVSLLSSESPTTTLRRWLLPGSLADFSPNGLRKRSRKTRFLLQPLIGIVWILSCIYLVPVRIFMLLLGGVLLLALVILRGLKSASMILLSPLLKITDYALQRTLKGYEDLLSSVLNKPGRVFVIMGLLILSIFIIARSLPTELIPEVHQGEFMVMLDFPVGTSLEWTDRLLRQMASAISKISQVDRVITFTGTDPVTASLYRTEGDNTGRITVFLKPTREFQVSENQVLERIRRMLANFPQAHYTIRRPTLFSMRNPIEVEIRGDNLEVLHRLGRDAITRLAAIPNIRDVALNMGEGYPEVQIQYDRDRIAQYNLDLLQVATLIRDKVLGNMATQLHRGEQRVDIRVRVRPEYWKSVQDLITLNVNPGGQMPIPLNSVANIRILQGPSEIRRIQQRRVALITANLDGFDLGGTADNIRSALSGLNIPDGYELQVSGQSREMQTSLKSMKLALSLAIFLVYVVMASQFESFLNPLLIMFSVPLASIGVLWALWVGGFSLNIVVLIGMIILAGIVVNNAIVLLDYIEQLRMRNIDRRNAIILAGKVRLRPILITTLTTILALIPMALGLGEGAELRQPMAWTIIAGLSSSTLLTLIFIPILYDQVSKVREKFAARTISTEQTLRRS